MSCLVSELQFCRTASFPTILRHETSHQSRVRKALQSKVIPLKIQCKSDWCKRFCQNCIKIGGGDGGDRVGQETAWWGAPGVNNCLKGLYWCQFWTSNTIDGPSTPLNHASCNVKRSGSFERNGIILVWEVSAIITKKSLKVKKVGLTNGFLQIYGVYRKSAASNAFAHP